MIFTSWVEVDLYLCTKLNPLGKPFEVFEAKHLSVANTDDL